MTFEQIKSFIHSIPPPVMVGFCIGIGFQILKMSVIGKAVRAAGFPAMVRDNVLALPQQQQDQFWEEYERGCKSHSSIFLCWLLLGWHYIYVGKWGTQFLFWLTGGGFLIWYFIDFFRIWGMVSNHNKNVAIETLKNLMALSTPMPPPVFARRAS